MDKWNVDLSYYPQQDVNGYHHSHYHPWADNTIEQQDRRSIRGGGATYISPHDKKLEDHTEQEKLDIVLVAAGGGGAGYYGDDVMYYMVLEVIGI